MAGLEDTLVMRRSRRSTAGNRMEAALAEFHAEDVGMDTEEDIEFVVEKDEEDAFESDFESTDEEAMLEDVDAAAEKVVREEERKTRRTAQSKLDKITAAAHVRQRATFNPQEQQQSDSSHAYEKLQRRVSLGVAVNAETGEIVSRVKRQSSRSHTMMNTSATVNRLKNEQEKKSALPKKSKVKTRAPTQDELIARALDMEEGNIRDHRDYLSIEEEKRKQARLVRTAVKGPLLRWVSRREEEKVATEPSPQHLYHHGYLPMTQSYNPAALSHPTASTSYLYPATTSMWYSPSTSTSTRPQEPPFNAEALPAAVAALPQADPVERTEPVSKNYVIHELTQSEKAVRPPWQSTMQAMFGDHVKWEELRVYITKGRPLARPVQTCLITGKPSRYRDPRSNVPFADLEAFKVLTRIIAHEYVWSDSLGCYLDPEAAKFT